MCWATIALAGDWVSWRGPEQNGTSPETGLPSSWSPDGENLLWTAPIGGRSTPLIMGGRVYVFTQIDQGVNEQERVACLDAATGDILWEHRFPVFLTTIVSSRLGWSSPAGDPRTGYVYVHGTGGLLICLSREGKVVWQRSLTEEFGRVSGYGGRLHTPVVDEDLVILSFLSSSWGSHAKGSHRYLALDKRDGTVVWWWGGGGKPLDATYSCPVVTVVNGQRLLIAPNADGAVHALKVRTGETVWTFRLSKRGVNSSPVVAGDRVFVSHSEENLDNTTMGRMVCIDATGRGDVTDTHEVWRYDGFKAGYTSPVLHAGRLYAVDNGANMACIDAGTGREIWRHNIGTIGKGSPVWADGKLYVGEVNGRFHILQAGRDGCASLDVEQLGDPDGTPVEIFGSPAVAHGHVYFMTRNALYCVGSKTPRGPATPPRPASREPAPASGAEPAKLLVVPGDVTIRPGEQVALRVRAYDATGRRVAYDGSQVRWRLPVPPPPPKRGPMKGTPQARGLRGTMGQDGVFAADPAITFQAGLVMAEDGPLTATARVRVAPGLPFREDFNDVADNGVPAGWIGVAGKCRVVTMDGEKVLKKLATSAHPAFARVHGRIAPVFPAGYTVAADVMGVNKGRRFRPDMGLLNSRYKLMLVGTTASPKLRIVAWSPMPRLQQQIDFDWRTKVWYRMKFSVELADGKALLKAKVWPRAEEEPADWALEAEDPTPYTEGSPGLYAYSTGMTDTPGTEVFFDNVQVTGSR